MQWSQQHADLCHLLQLYRYLSTCLLLLDKLVSLCIAVAIEELTILNANSMDHAVASKPMRPHNIRIVCLQVWTISQECSIYVSRNTTF